MKNYIIILSLLISLSAGAQQLPVTESYLTDPFVLSSAYAGVHNTNTVLANFRSDWTGIPGGPKTFRLSYHQTLPVLENVAVGGRIVADQMDIFRQNYLMTSYAYTLKLTEEHLLNFGLSFGFYRNSINPERYYSPDNESDPVLTDGAEKSSIKFMTDYSALYRWNDLEAGIVFTNVTFGDSYYGDALGISNKPLGNFNVHASYRYKINDLWSVKPFVLFRTGRNIPSQLEIAAQGFFRDTYWASLLYRGKGIWSAGIGGEITQGVSLSYSYNAGYDINISAFQNHEISIGIHIPSMLEYIK